MTAVALAPWDRTTRAYRMRWWTLLVMCVSLLIIIVDNTILNVAIPTLQRSLGASNSEVQWITDAYALVFAGLLLTAGALGDRYGRRGALQVGFVIFGLGSLISSFVDSPSQLVFTRAIMGVGAALIMPATLSIITNTFPPEERGRAIGMWAGVAGIAGALGPISGGFLLDHFYWGSIFLINLPIVIFALVASVLVVPTSKDPSRPKQDPIGSLLSIIGLGALVYGIIEGGNYEVGWGDPRTVIAFSVAAVGLLAFALWERHCDHPMLDTTLFANPRFSAASFGIAAVFFAMFGSQFLTTQYLQLILGYTPFEAGVRLLPMAATMMIVAPNSPRFVERFGTKAVVATGLFSVSFALVLFSRLSVDSSYLNVIWRMVFMAIGLALVMAPATESIMGSLPRAKAGVGSAVNDTTRQVGGALGIAVVGSVMSSAYSQHVAPVVAAVGLKGEQAASVKGALGGTYRAALDLRASGSPDKAAHLIEGAKAAFIPGMHRGMLVAASMALIGAIVAVCYLPSRPTVSDEVTNAAPVPAHAPT